MIHLLFEGMLLLGIAYGVVTGHAALLGTAAVTSAREAVSLGISMLGVVSMWTGLMEIARECGLLRQMTRALRKPVSWLFPNVPAGHPAEEAILANLAANILGLGWAATPAGLIAMRELRTLQLEQAQKAGLPEPESASTDMCTFLIINISSLQLIPVNILAYRSQYGSVNPAAIVGVSILVTSLSTIIGVIYARFKAKRSRQV